jgi:hypothetical protein
MIVGTLIYSMAPPPSFIDTKKTDGESNGISLEAIESKTASGDSGPLRKRHTHPVAAS